MHDLKKERKKKKNRGLAFLAHALEKPKLYHDGTTQTGWVVLMRLSWRWWRRAGERRTEGWSCSRLPEALHQHLRTFAVNTQPCCDLLPTGFFPNTHTHTHACEHTHSETIRQRLNAVIIYFSFISFLWHFWYELAPKHVFLFFFLFFSLFSDQTIIAWERNGFISRLFIWDLFKVGVEVQCQSLVLLRHRQFTGLYFLIISHIGWKGILDSHLSGSV